MADHLGGDVYRILSHLYDREIVSWQFQPGDDVVREQIESSEGRILAATKIAG
jgi:hypothetical protein